MPALGHSFKTLRREWRSGELRIIAAALIVAVAAVTAVTLFTDRVRQAMVLRANTLLAADLALDSSFPIAEPYLEEARRLGLAGQSYVERLRKLSRACSVKSKIHASVRRPFKVVRSLNKLLNSKPY